MTLNRSSQGLCLTAWLSSSLLGHVVRPPAAVPVVLGRKLSQRPRRAVQHVPRAEDQPHQDSQWDGHQPHDSAQLHSGQGQCSFSLLASFSSAAFWSRSVLLFYSCILVKVSAHLVFWPHSPPHLPSGQGQCSYSLLATSQVHFCWTLVIRCHYCVDTVYLFTEQTKELRSSDACCRSTWRREIIWRGPGCWSVWPTTSASFRLVSSLPSQGVGSGCLGW